MQKQNKLLQLQSKNFVYQQRCRPHSKMTSSDGQKLFFYLLYNYNHVLTLIIKVLVYYKILFCTLIQPLVLKFRYIRNPQY